MCAEIQVMRNVWNDRDIVIKRSGARDLRHMFIVRITEIDKLIAELEAFKASMIKTGEV